MNRLQILLSSLLMVIGCNLIANETASDEILEQSSNTLFEGKVYLDTSDTDAETKALREAFNQVLVKVSGDSRVTQQIDQSQIDDLSRRWVIELGRVDLPGLTSTDFAMQSAQGLIAYYNRESIINFIKTNGLPIWPYDRPKILIWVVIENWDGSVRFMNNVIDEQSLKSLEYVAERRGIKPIIAVQENIAANTSVQWLPSEAWNFNERVLRSVSQQYNVDYLGIIRLSLAEDQSATGNAFYLDDSEQLLFNASGANQLELFEQLVSPFIDIISKRNSFISGTVHKKNAELIFTNLTNYVEYAQLINEIEALEMVSSVKLERIVSIDNNFSELYLSVAFDSEEQVLISNIIQIDGIIFIDRLSDMLTDLENIDELSFNINNLKYLFKVID